MVQQTLTVQMLKKLQNIQFLMTRGASWISWEVPVDFNPEQQDLKNGPFHTCPIGASLTFLWDWGLKSYLQLPNN